MPDSGGHACLCQRSIMMGIPCTGTPPSIDGWNLRHDTSYTVEKKQNWHTRHSLGTPRLRTDTGSQIQFHQELLIIHKPTIPAEFLTATRLLVNTPAELRKHPVLNCFGIGPLRIVQSTKNQKSNPSNSIIIRITASESLIRIH
jgi:hypothetical protein